MAILGLMCEKICQKCGKKVKVYKTTDGIDDTCHNCGWRVNTLFAPLPSTVPTSRVGTTPAPDQQKPAISPLQPNQPPVQEKKVEPPASDEPSIIAEALKTHDDQIVELSKKIDFLNSEQKRIITLIDKKADKPKPKKKTTKK